MANVCRECLLLPELEQLAKQRGTRIKIRKNRKADECPIETAVSVGRGSSEERRICAFGSTPEGIEFLRRRRLVE